MPEYKIYYHSSEGYELSVTAETPAEAKKIAQQIPFDEWQDTSSTDGHYEMDLIKHDEETGEKFTAGYINWYHCDE